MAAAGPCNRWKVEGRRQPIGLSFPEHKLFVVGHYDVTCGGADTIKSKDRCYETAEAALAQGWNVLIEGIFLAVELHRTVALAERGVDRHDVFIDIPMADCIASVNARRVADGKEPKELKQMEPFYRRIMRTRDRLLEAGIDPATVHLFSSVFHGEDQRSIEETRTMALNKTRELLGI
jgi:hypothetical protein